MADSTQGTFYIETETSGDGLVLRPVGELDIATADELSDALQGGLTSDVPRVVLDLGGVSFIDSAGVRCLLLAVAASEATEANKLRVRRAHSEQVTRLLELIGALDRLPYE